MTGVQTCALPIYLLSRNIHQTFSSPFNWACAEAFSQVCTPACNFSFPGRQTRDKNLSDRQKHTFRVLYSTLCIGTAHRTAFKKTKGGGEDGGGEGQSAFPVKNAQRTHISYSTPFVPPLLSPYLSGSWILPARIALWSRLR